MEVDCSVPVEPISSKVCSNCQTATSIIWHRKTLKPSTTNVDGKQQDNAYWCNFCETKMRLLLADRIQPLSAVSSLLSDGKDSDFRKTESSSPSSSVVTDDVPESRSNRKPTTRTSANNKASSRNTPLAVPSKLATNPNSRSKSRKRLRKNTEPEKSALQRATVVTGKILWHNGVLFSVGDIVSVVDEIDNHVYYAQIRGLLKDQLCNKFAAVTWMLPKANTNLQEIFCFKNYVYGPHDEQLYDLDCLEFVCPKETRLESLPTNDESNNIHTSDDDELCPVKQFAGL